MYVALSIGTQQENIMKLKLSSHTQISRKLPNYLHSCKRIEHTHTHTNTPTYTLHRIIIDIKSHLNVTFAQKSLFHHNFCFTFAVFVFQFDNIDGNTPLKMFQRTPNYECSTPMSPTAPSSTQQYSRNYRGSALFR